MSDAHSSDSYYVKEEKKEMKRKKNGDDVPYRKYGRVSTRFRVRKTFECRANQVFFRIGRSRRAGGLFLPYVPRLTSAICKQLSSASSFCCWGVDVSLKS